MCFVFFAYCIKYKYVPIDKLLGIFKKCVLFGLKIDL